MIRIFKTRIGRLLAAAIIPAGTILGTAHSTFADRYDHRDEHHRRWFPMYRAESNGVPIAVRFSSVSDDTLQGILVVGATEFPFGGRFDGYSYRGVIAMGRDCYSFCATFDGNGLHFVCNNVDIVLQAC